MTEVFLAWCAGFFDGEGSVSIYRRERFEGRKTFILRVTAAQKDPRPLSLFADAFGGIVAPPSGKSSVCYHWITTTRKAEAFLRAIRPYTIVKSDQIDVALRFMERRVPRGQGTSIAFREAREHNKVADQNDADRLRQLKVVA